MLVDKMNKTMAIERGIGLAANQIGWSLNLFIIDTNKCADEKPEIQIFINAEILHSEGESIIEEGCLSLPEIRAEIKRPETIILKYQDIEKKFHERQYSGFISRVIQHEMDHLNGKLFIDYLSQAKRTLINKRILEIAKSGKPSSGIIL